MFKKNFLFLLLIPMLLGAAHKYDSYVDAEEGLPEKEETRLPIILKTVENKRNLALNETSKQNVTVSSGKLLVGDKNFRHTPIEEFKTIVNKENLNISLNELKDYFLGVRGDNNKILKLTYHLVDGGQKGKHLYVFLTHYSAGRMVNTETKEVFINLTQLIAEKKKELESVELRVTVDGPKMENSSVEAVPVFKEDNRAPQATPERPSCTLSQASARS
jgi:hypothetical protein